MSISKIKIDGLKIIWLKRFNENKCYLTKLGIFPNCLDDNNT